MRKIKKHIIQKEVRFSSKRKNILSIFLPGSKKLRVKASEKLKIKYTRESPSKTS